MIPRFEGQHPMSSCSIWQLNFVSRMLLLLILLFLSCIRKIQVRRNLNFVNECFYLELWVILILQQQRMWNLVYLGWIKGDVMNELIKLTQKKKNRIKRKIQIPCDNLYSCPCGATFIVNKIIVMNVTTDHLLSFCKISSSYHLLMCASPTAKWLLVAITPVKWIPVLH